MMKMSLGWLVALSLLLTGCLTDNTEVKPLSWAQQQSYMKRVRDPRIFGLSIYDSPSGPQIRGGGRLHPNQGEILEMQAKEPMKPVVLLQSGMGREHAILLDPALMSSWMEFSTAQHMQARPVGERDATLVRVAGDDVGGCLSLVPTLRLGQFHVENTLVYVRMADGPIGTLSRGITKPIVKGVIGWNVLKNLAQVNLLYSSGQVLLLSTEPYEPNPERVVAALPLVEHAGVCAVRVEVDGRQQMVLIDPAGDFEAAGFSGSLELAPGLSFEADAPGPGGLRIGAGGLSRYDVTICPASNVIFFEKRADLL
jgi:hypothetical protein